MPGWFQSWRSKQLLEQLDGVLGAGDGVADGALAGEDLVVVAPLPEKSHR